MEASLPHKPATRIAPASAPVDRTGGGGDGAAEPGSTSGAALGPTLGCGSGPGGKSGPLLSATDVKSEGGHTEAKTRSLSATGDNHADGADGTRSTPKKRRKVNHAYDVRPDKERPCTRCIKRNIGHLCHDEPRDSDSRKSKSVVGASTTDDFDDYPDHHHSTSLDHKSSHAMPPPVFDTTAAAAAATAATAKTSPFQAAVLAQANPLQQLSRQGHISSIQPSALRNDFSQFAWLTAQDHFHDMHTHPNLVVPEVSGELQFLNDFLQYSMIDDTNQASDDQNAQILRSAPPDIATSFLTAAAARDTATSESINKAASAGAGTSKNTQENLSPDNTAAATISKSLLAPSANTLDGGSMLPPKSTSSGVGAGAGSNNTEAGTGTGTGKVGATVATSGTDVAPADKAREYYFQAADPSGDATPEQRMLDLLKAKYEANLLKPFNYVNGYKRLHNYLDGHKIALSSKQKIQRQLDRFRPKFREKMQALTDIELIYVEMWFEKTLMEYDRVFASMAVPACCWRRTGEIVRGNKEMAELIAVPVERLRDGIISLHEIMTEESMVRYWEEFGTIAFDTQHDTLLTACSIKNPDDNSLKNGIIQCCFSLKVRRDDHKIPSLIVGNFLRVDPLTK